MEKIIHKRKIEFIDIMIIIVLLATVGLGLWMLFGSPTEIQAIIALSIFFGTSGFMLLRQIHKVDKNSIVKFSRVKNSFLKVKHNIEKNHIEVTNRLNLLENNINNKLDKIIKKK